MKKLSGRSLKAIKAAHLVGVTVWVSGVLCTLLVLIWAAHQITEETVLASLSLIDLLDYALIIPGATICYLVGTTYGLFTAWGFVKNRWIALKWVLYNLACIPAMVLALPSVEAMRQFIVLNGPAAIATSEFQVKLIMHGALSGYILIVAVVIVLVSVYRPFKKKK
jgi:hypothetical protein